MNWNNLTIDKYQQLLTIENSEYSDIIDKGVAMVSIIYDVDALNMPFNDFNSLLGTLTFLGDKITPNKVKNEYILNGRKYNLYTNYTDLTTAQYIDYTNYSKNNDYIGMLSVVLLPTNHQYNDGYDIEQVKDDVSSMSVTDAFGIATFFLTSSKIYTRLILRYLRQRLTMMLKGKKKEEKAKLIKEMKALEEIVTAY